MLTKVAEVGKLGSWICDNRRRLEKVAEVVWGYVHKLEDAPQGSLRNVLPGVYRHHHRTAVRVPQHVMASADPG